MTIPTFDRPLKVIQWTTGNIGRRSLHAILDRPDLELVGVFAHGVDKFGKDAAELCGWPEPTGVLATNDIDALLALGADAAFVGRPVLWGLAVGGEEGVARVLALLRAELDVALALCGCARPSDVTSALLRP